MQLLQGDDRERGRAARGDGLGDGLRARHRRHARHVELERGAPDGLLVVVGDAPEGRVDDEGDLALAGGELLVSKLGTCEYLNGATLPDGTKVPTDVDNPFRQPADTR